MIAIAVDIGNGIGSKPAMLAETATRGLGRPQLSGSMSPPVVGNCSKVLRHRRNGCCATKQISGAFRAHCRGKGKRARSACGHRTEEARHRSVRIDDALQILPVSPSDATRHPSLDFLGSKIN